MITSGLALGTEVNNSTYINRSSFDYGLQYQFFLKKNRSITIGAVYNNRLRLNTSQQTTIYRQRDTLSNDKQGVADYVLPQKFWGGVGIPVSGRRNSFNLTYSHNHSGGLENSLIQQQSQIISLDLTFRDLWGIKRKFN